MDIAPNEIFSGYSTDGSSITIPLTDLPGLSAAEAVADTGDGRKVIYAVVEKFYQILQSLDVADRPTKMALTKQQPAGAGVNLIRVPYTISFDLTIDPNTIEVAPEA